jgi:hypothetical protein
MIKAPPRRVSIDEDGLSFTRLRCQVAIFVNGERMSRVLAYDVDQGFVERIVTDGKGYILIEDGEVVTETLRGKVQVGWLNA